MTNFDQLVDSVKKLSLSEKENLQNVLGKFIDMERRDSIYRNFEDIFNVNQVHTDMAELQASF